MKNLKELSLNVLWFISLPFVWLFACTRLLSIKMKSSRYKKMPEDFLIEERYSNVNFLTKLAQYLYRVKIKEFPDKSKLVNKPQIIICNHRSLLDAMLIFNLCFEQLGPKFIFIAKKELQDSKFGFILDYIDSIYLDRQNIREAIKIIDTQKELIKQGKTIIIFPEGTRSSGNEFNEFKSGAFEVAYKALCPIQPFVITHTNEYYEDRKQIRKKDRQPVQLSIMDDYKPHNFISIDRMTFSKNIQKSMQSKYDNLIKTTDK